jgi:hypothetical protein
VENYQVLDQLTLLVDKSLVVAENTSGRTRYRLLETVRQYALEKLGESGEADRVRGRHRDRYTSMAALLDTPARTGHEQRLEQAETEIDNVRTAFAWSRESSDIGLASQLGSSLPGHRTRGSKFGCRAGPVSFHVPPTSSDSVVGVGPPRWLIRAGRLNARAQSRKPFARQVHDVTV